MASRMPARAHHLAAVILAVLAAGATNGAAAADDLDTLARDFWAWRARTQPFNRDDISRIERPEGWKADWSAAAMADRRRALAGFETRRQALDASGWPVPRQVDLRLIGSAMARVRWELELVRSWRRDPTFYLDQTLGALVDVFLPPPPFDARRSATVARYVALFPRTLEEAKTNLDQATAPFARLAIADLTGIGPRLRAAIAGVKPLLAAADARSLDADTDRAVAALDGYRTWLEARLPAMPAESAVGRDAYVFFLAHVALLPFTPEELLAMGRQEWERSMAFEAYERQKNEGRPELAILADQASQIARQEKDEEAIRRFLDERGILSVPAWVKRYRYRAVPPYLEPLAGFGEWTEFTSDTRLGEDATRYIPVPSKKLGYFALSMAQDPRADMVHEGVPGHYFQMALSWKHEDEIRRRYYDSGANEGIGFYAEEMMLQAGLFDDSPRTRDMIYSYMRLRALRVEVDVKLALGAFTIDQAADYLARTVPMDAQTARQEASFFASIPGQAITYQIGKLQILRFLADARRVEGSAFRLRAFHDFVWKNGNVPLALQRWEHLGLADEIALLDGR
jgi:hypothetical protein